MQKIDSTTYHSLVNSDKLTIVKYSADWCGPCKVLTPIIDGVLKSYPDVNAGEVNIDVHSDLAIKDGIRSVPTVIFFKNGQPIDKMVGLQPAQAYTNKIESLK